MKKKNDKFSVESVLNLSLYAFCYSSIVQSLEVENSKMNVSVKADQGHAVFLIQAYHVYFYQNNLNFNFRYLLLHMACRLKLHTYGHVFIFDVDSQLYLWCY